MTEKKRKTIVYAIFAIAVIWGIMNNPFNRKKPQWEDDSSASETIQPISTAGVGMADTKLTLSDKWGSDPFAQKSTAAKTDQSSEVQFNLTAISKSEGEYWALINGRILAVNDSIEGWTVTQVTGKNVTLSKNGKTISLKIKGV